MDLAAVVIVVYLLAMLAIGAWGLRMKGLEDFHLAGRSIKNGSSYRHFLCHHHRRFGNSWHGRFGLQQGPAGAWWMLSGTAGLLVLATFFAEK